MRGSAVVISKITEIAEDWASGMILTTLMPCQRTSERQRGTETSYQRNERMRKNKHNFHESKRRTDNHTKQDETKEERHED
mmetsp:Transcript_6059/g.6672  ORF Transcript_6059/g.6672 Transcript_6059/m.6672 type:complete len:81 (-) Transcript_6059:136-378(-)